MLTRREWKGVVDFAQALNAKIVTSFAISEGVRDAAGVWTSDQARRLFAYTRSVGGNVAAAEFFNEPSYVMMGGGPKGIFGHTPHCSEILAASGRRFPLRIPWERLEEMPRTAIPEDLKRLQNLPSPAITLREPSRGRPGLLSNGG